MGQRPRILESSASSRHFFGAELRRLRAQAGLSQAQLGAMVRFSADQIRRVETADRFPSEQLAIACDHALASDGALARLWPVLEQARSAPRPAGRMPGAGSPVLPGHGGADDRSEFLRRVPFQPGVLDRVALDWLTGDQQANPTVDGDEWVTDEDVCAADTALRMFRELDHTQGAGRIQAGVQHYIEQELNRLLTGSPVTDAVGARLHSLAAGFFELCGYQAVDTGADGLAQRRYLRALRLAQLGGDRAYGGYLLTVNIAHLALHCNHPDLALRTALAAVSGTDGQASPAVRAALHAVVARALARLGQELACGKELRTAEALLSRSRMDDEPGWIRYFTPAYLADEMAHCFHDLGQPQLAQQHVREALTALQPSHVRRLAIDTALLASSLAAANQIEEACSIARRAVDHAAATASHRCVQRIVEVQVDLEPYRMLPQVKELREYVREKLPLAAV